MCESKLLMFDDFEEGKLNKEHWTHGAQALKIDWKTKGGKLEILPTGVGWSYFGYGKVAFKNFGLQFDFQPLTDKFGHGCWVGLLFRASEDFKFYQLYVTPADGVGTKNYAVGTFVPMKIEILGKNYVIYEPNCLFPLPLNNGTH